MGIPDVPAVALQLRVDREYILLEDFNLLRPL